VEHRECRARIRHWAKAIPAGEELGASSQRTLRGLGGRHAEKERQRKLGTTRRRPRPARAGTARASHITRRTGKLGRVWEWGGWGRLSVDGLGHYNPDRSEGPWGRAVKPLARRCRSCAMNFDTERGLFRRQGGTKDGCKPRDAMIRRHEGRPLPISRPWSRTGENPPYGILGRTMETSASFEARSAPSSYPTIATCCQAQQFAHTQEAPKSICKAGSGRINWEGAKSLERGGAGPRASHARVTANFAFLGKFEF